MPYGVINQSVAGTTQLVAAVPGQRVRVVNYVIVMSAAGAVKFRSGASTDMTGPMDVSATGGVSAKGSHDAPLLQTEINQALNIVTTGGAARGHFFYFLD